MRRHPAHTAFFNSPQTKIGTILLAAATMTVSGVDAATYTWTGGLTGDWDTTTSNWDSGVWVNSNDALFTGGASTSTLTLTENITATSLTRNDTSGTGRLDVVASTTETFDVTTISALGSAGDIKITAEITGSHDLNIVGPNNSFNQSGARIQLLGGASYTGDTYLSNYAYLLADSYSNYTALAVGTKLDIAGGSSFALKYHTEEISGLTGSGQIRGTSDSLSSNLAKVVINTVSGESSTFSGNFGAGTDILTLEVKGEGTQRFSNGSVTYGDVTVSGGTFDLGGSLTNAASVTINGGNLTGDAAENITLGAGDVAMSAGSISAGGTGSVGAFTIAANQNLTVTGGTLFMDVGVAELDQILGSGSGIFSLDGLTIALSLLGDFDYNSTYELLSGFASGSVNNATITGYDTSNWVAALDASGGNLTLSFSSIPEPSTVALILGGVVGVVGIVRRRRV